MIDKLQLKKEYIKELNKRLEAAKKNHSSAKFDVIEAEGRMVTRYDSTKTEMGWLADGYLKEVKELERVIFLEETNVVFANVLDTVITNKLKGKKIEEVSVLLDRKTDKALFDGLLGAFEDATVYAEEDDGFYEYTVKKIIKPKTQENNDVVKIGSVVAVETNDGYNEYYYIVNDRGGFEINFYDEEFLCISRTAPVAQSMFAKKVGDEVTININMGLKGKITEII